MTQFKNLVLTLMLVASSSATTGESARTATTQLGTRSISLAIPDGWEQRDLSVNYNGTRPLFALVPIGSKAAEQDLTGGLYVLVSYYPSRSSMAAQSRWEDLGPPMSELPLIYGQPDWSLFERPHDFAAFTPVGKDVLVIHVHVPDENDDGRGKGMLLQMVKSYREERTGESVPCRVTNRCSGP